MAWTGCVEEWRYVISWRVIMEMTHLIQTIGYLGLFAILFAETGLLVGFFLPGDTLLISAGLLASRGQLHIGAVLAVLIAGAVLGDAAGYWIGRQAGQRLFRRDDSFWFRSEHLEKAQRFYQRHGGKTIFLARFVTGLRTFAPIVAGAARMPYPRFAAFNVAGAICWICSITLAGYAFGGAVTRFDHYIFIGSVVLLPFPLVMALTQGVRLRRARLRLRARLEKERSMRQEDDGYGDMVPAVK
jgi:membrane-associated protein